MFQYDHMHLRFLDHFSFLCHHRNDTHFFYASGCNQMIFKNPVLEIDRKVDLFVYDYDQAESLTSRPGKINSNFSNI